VTEQGSDALPAEHGELWVRSAAEQPQHGFFLGSDLDWLVRWLDSPKVLEREIAG
jgi:hypothetical protein